jgi:hypothetical protein
MKTKNKDSGNKQPVIRKAWGAQIDAELASELKHLSVDLNTPVYLLAEEAFKMLIENKKRLLSKSKKK